MKTTATGHRITLSAGSPLSLVCACGWSSPATSAHAMNEAIKAHARPLLAQARARRAAEAAK